MEVMVTPVGNADMVVLMLSIMPALPPVDADDIVPKRYILVVATVATGGTGGAVPPPPPPPPHPVSATAEQIVAQSIKINLFMCKSPLLESLV
jgi:hypothetical protein